MTDFLYSYNYSFSGHSDNSVPESFSMRNDKTNTYFHYENQNDASGKTLMILGDSYIWTFLLPMLSESFTHLYFLGRNTDKEIIYELFNMAKPDFILVETVARATFYNELLQYTKGLKEVFSLESHHLKQLRKEVFENLDNLPLNNKDCFLTFDNGTRTISLKESNYTITGWAIDNNLDDSPLAVIAVIGGKNYLCNISQRSDISAAWGEKYINAGFQLPLEKDSLIKGENYMYIISKDSTKSNKIIIEIEK